MIYLIRYLWAIFTVFSVGYTVLRVIDRQGYHRGVLLRAALAWGAGIGVVALLQLYALALDIPLTLPVVTLLSAPFVVSHCLSILRRLRPGVPFARQSAGGGVMDKESRLLRNLLGGVIVLLCVLMVVTCLIMPFYSWDGRAIWGFKASVLFEQKGVFNDDFLDPHRFHPHQAYPLLVPLSLHFFYSFLGRVDEYLVKIIFAGMYISLLLVMYGALRRHFAVSRTRSLAGVALFACIPALFTVYCGSVPSVYADFPLGFLYAVSVIYMTAFLKTRRREDLFLGALFTVFTLFTKNEGIVLCLLLVLVVVVDLFLARKRIPPEVADALIAAGGGVVMLIMPWFFIRARLPLFDANNPLAVLGAERIAAGLHLFPLVVKLTMREMFLNLRTWGLSWYLASFAAGYFLVSGAGEKTAASSGIFC
ncbi:MAG: hypothetical protein MJA29_01475 [Candidatus Omnitrophica bacterium]|nr:hypothetical protein [Candidatus Omnitrophota bacterium]